MTLKEGHILTTTLSANCRRSSLEVWNLTSPAKSTGATSSRKRTMCSVGSKMPRHTHAALAWPCEVSGLLSLPTELLLTVLDFFDVVELTKLRTLCRDMQWLVDLSIELQTDHSFILCRFRQEGFVKFISKARSMRRLVLLYAEPSYDWGWAELLSVPRVQETLHSLEAYPWPPQCGLFLIAPLLRLQSLRLESTEEQDLTEDAFYLSHLTSLRRLSLKWFTGVINLLREMPLDNLAQLVIWLPMGSDPFEAGEVEQLLDEAAERNRGKGDYSLVLESAQGRRETYWRPASSGSRLPFTKLCYLLHGTNNVEPMQVHG